MEAAGTKKKLRKLHTGKETFSDTQSGFNVWCLVSSACSQGSSQKSHQLLQKQAARAYQSPAGYTPSHPAGKGTILTLLHMWGDTGSALPKHALLQENEKKKKITQI